MIIHQVFKNIFIKLILWSKTWQIPGWLVQVHVIVGKLPWRLKYWLLKALVSKRLSGGRVFRVLGASPSLRAWSSAYNAGTMTFMVIL